MLFLFCTFESGSENPPGLLSDRSVSHQEAACEAHYVFRFTSGRLVQRSTSRTDSEQIPCQ